MCSVVIAPCESLAATFDHGMETLTGWPDHPPIRSKGAIYTEDRGTISKRVGDYPDRCGNLITITNDVAAECGTVLSGNDSNRRTFAFATVADRHQASPSPGKPTSDANDYELKTNFNNSNLREWKDNSHIHSIAIYIPGYGNNEKQCHSRCKSGSAILSCDTNTTQDGRACHPTTHCAVAELPEDSAKVEGNKPLLILDCVHCPLNGSPITSSTGMAGFTALENPVSFKGGLCGVDEAARESNKLSHSTTVLFATLCGTNITSMSSIDLSKALSEVSNQEHPQCQGVHKDILLFTADAAIGDNSHFFLVRNEGQAYRLLAAESHGVFLGAFFSVLKNTPSTFQITHVGSDDSIPEPSDKGYSDCRSVPSKLVQTQRERTRFPEKLTVHFSDRFEACTVKRILVNAMEALNLKEEDNLIVVVERNEAVLIVDQDQDQTSAGGIASFSMRISHPKVGGVYRLALHSSANSVEEMSAAIRTVAQWNWSRLRGESLMGQNDISVEFYPLQYEYDLLNEPFNMILSPKQPLQSIISDNVIDVVPNPYDSYGLKIVNNTSTDLFAHLFYLGLKHQSIEHNELGPLDIHGTGVSLMANSHITVGYGAGRNSGDPFSFELQECDRGEDQLGFIKLFLTTAAVNSNSLVQFIPFQNHHETSIGLNDQRIYSVSIPVIERG
ncbi:hypothetical protein BU17DRAFT_64658 [Hysterangium stoloniferum]|nr:hypothetical protein BU17DRAFT_64658 [Hysterangium stoloniferum]